jgi:hypothetical protein
MSTPVPLKKGIHIFQKGTQLKWLTSKRDGTKQIRVSSAKGDAAKWVIEPVGQYFTIRVMNTKNFLAAGSLTSNGDCTALITSKPIGKSHHWSITSTNAGLKIRTVQSCLERGKKVVQFLKVAGGSRLELASRDSGTFGTILIGGTNPMRPAPPNAAKSRDVITKKNLPPGAKYIVKKANGETVVVMKDGQIKRYPKGTYTAAQPRPTPAKPTTTSLVPPTKPTGKKVMHIFQKGTQVKWLTSKRDGTKQIRVSSAKGDAAKWVVEQVGQYFTIRILNTKNFLAAGSLTSNGDCTAVFTSKPIGKSHHWRITSTNAGLKIRTVQPCIERGKKVVQFLKVAGGSRLELASRDSGTFGTLLIGRAAAKPRPTPTKPTTTSPAPTPATPRLPIKKASRIPKVMAIEPYTKPRYFVSPRVFSSQGYDGTLQLSPTRAMWYTLIDRNSISIRAQNIKGPQISVAQDCRGLVLDKKAPSNMNRFQIGSISGYDGFVINTSGACTDGKTRYLVTHSNGAIGLGTVGPTTKNVTQYLWRFIVGTIPPPTPTPTPSPIPEPTFTFTPSPSPFPDNDDDDSGYDNDDPWIDDAGTQSPFPDNDDDDDYEYDPAPSPTPSPFPDDPWIDDAGTQSPFPDDNDDDDDNDDNDDDDSGYEDDYDPTPSPFPDVVNAFTPTQNPFPDPYTISPYPNKDININIDMNPGNPQAVFPYPVVPDLLLGVNPDMSLESPVPSTETPEETSTTEPDMEGEEEIEFPEEEEEEDEFEVLDDTFWTPTRIGIALVTFILVGIAGYYIYKNINQGGTNNNGVSNVANNNINAPPVNTSSNNANLGTLGTNSGFGDGFDEFANVGNLGPPPTTR